MVIVKVPNKVSIDTHLKAALQGLVEDKAQVITHKHFHFCYTSCIGIWKSTFLTPHNSTTKINLSHAINITFFSNIKKNNSGVYQLQINYNNKI
jgi:hypothetical protein